MDSSDKRPLYLQIALKIKTAVKNGEYPANTKLPSERRLASKMSVSRNTVRLAIEGLIAEGVLVSKSKSGTYTTDKSWENVTSGKAPDWPGYLNVGIHVSRFTERLDNPDRLPSVSSRFPGASMSFYKKFFENVGVDRSQYAKLYMDEAKDSYGSVYLRQELAKHLKKYNINATEKNILISSSTTQATYLLTEALLGHGSNFYHESSSYINLRDITSAVSANIVRLPMGDCGPVISKVKSQALFQKRAVFHIQPSNHHPTGITTSVERRHEILEVFCGRGIPVIEMDSMLEIYAETPPPPPLKALDKSNSVIFISNMARTTSEDISMSWLVADEYIINHLTALRRMQDKHVNTMTQLIAELALSTGFYDEYLKEFRTYLIKRRDSYNEIMHKYLSDVATWHPTRSSYYFWPEFVKELNINKLKSNMTEVTFNPGSLYDPDDASHISVCTLAMPPKQFEKAIKYMKKMIMQTIRSGK